MAHNVSSPFESPIKDTSPQTPSINAWPGPVPTTPPADYPNPLAIDLGTTGASWDSPYNEVIVTSTSVVKETNPGGTGPLDSPFTDKIK